LPYFHIIFFAKVLQKIKNQELFRKKMQ